MIIEGESLPVTLGATAPKGNYGSLRTKGWELSADFTHRFPMDWELMLWLLFPMQLPI